MNFSALVCLGELLDEVAHLVICDEESALVEVIAMRKGNELLDAFPLPIEVQCAAVEVAQKFSMEPNWLSIRTAGRLELDQLPEDFWEGAEERPVGENLTVTFLGRAGRKYLHFYRAVREEGKGDLDDLKRLALKPPELAQVTQWIRVEGLFDHRSGETIMKILTELGS